MSLLWPPWTIARQAPVYGISQAKILEWVAISFSGGSFSGSPALADGVFTTELPGQPWKMFYVLLILIQFSSVQSLSCIWLCDPMDLQHVRLLCPSPIPGACPNSCPSRWWCYPTISSSVIPFSCLQSFLTSGSFPMSKLFTSGGQSIGASASASVLPMNTQDWSPLGWTGLISLQSKGLSRVFSNTTVH